jgi:hypothetical protein
MREGIARRLRRQFLIAAADQNQLQWPRRGFQAMRDFEHRNRAFAPE